MFLRFQRPFSSSHVARSSICHSRDIGERTNRENERESSADIRVFISVSVSTGAITFLTSSGGMKLSITRFLSMISFSRTRIVSNMSSRSRLNSSNRSDRSALSFLYLEITYATRPCMFPGTDESPTGNTHHAPPPHYRSTHCRRLQSIPH